MKSRYALIIVEIYHLASMIGISYLLLSEWRVVYEVDDNHLNNRSSFSFFKYRCDS